MKLSAICVDNSGFEDQFTTGKNYPVLTLCPTGSSVTTKNDKGETKSYGVGTVLQLEFNRECGCKKSSNSEILG